MEKKEKMSEISIKLLFLLNVMAWKTWKSLFLSAFTPEQRLNVCLYSRSALCEVIYLCRVCCVSIKSGAWLSKLELNEKFLV